MQPHDENECHNKKKKKDNDIEKKEKKKKSIKKVRIYMIKQWRACKYAMYNLRENTWSIATQK